MALPLQRRPPGRPRARRSRRPRHRTVRHHRRPVGPRLAGRPPAQAHAMPSWSAWPSPRSCSAALRAALAAVCWRPAGPSVPVPANQPGLQQAAATGRAAGGLGHPGTGRPHPQLGDQLRLVDSTPVPCAASRQTVKRSALAGVPAMASARATTAASGASGCMCWPPLTASRWPGVWPPPSWASGRSVAPVGPRAAAGCGRGCSSVDKGFAGCRVRPAGRRPRRRLAASRPGEEPPRLGSLGRWRQWIEAPSTPSRASLGWNATAAAPGRGPRPGRPAAAGPGRGDLVELADRRARQALAGRLRPLNPRPPIGSNHLARTGQPGCCPAASDTWSVPCGSGWREGSNPQPAVTGQRQTVQQVLACALLAAQVGWVVRRVCSTGGVRRGGMTERMTAAAPKPLGNGLLTLAT